ncbi:MAG: hypothetical protein PWQ08_112 [Clostridiales bacterium]|nr:hypothetical protein [Clostridiales bacterium]
MWLQAALYNCPQKPLKGPPLHHIFGRLHFGAHLAHVYFNRIPMNKKTDPFLRWACYKHHVILTTYLINGAVYPPHPTLKILFKVELRPDSMVPAPAVEFVCAFSCFARSQAHPRSPGFLGPFFNFCQQGLADALLLIFA